MGVVSTQLVELFGQPGAGKTTLVCAAAGDSAVDTIATLRARWNQRSIFTKGWFLARALLDGPTLVCAIQLAMGARLYHGNSLARLILLLTKSRWVRSQPGMYLLSEGFLQDLWSIHYSAGSLDPEPRLLAPLIRRLYRDLDVQIIFLEVEPRIAFNRIRGRTNGQSRLDRLPEAELQRHLDAAAPLPNRIIEAAKLAGLQVHSLDASLPVEQAVDLLRERIK